MNKLRVKITGVTDLSKAINDLEWQLLTLGISNNERETLISKVEETAKDLTRRGKELAAIGSQFQVERVFQSESCQVALDVKFGTEKSSLGDNLRALLAKLRG